MENVFSDERFLAWSRDLSDKFGAQLSVVVKFPTGDYVRHGCDEIGFDILSDILTNKKKISMDWVKDPKSLKRLKMPLSHMKQPHVLSEAPHVLRHFIGHKTKYGVGDCHFWYHEVDIINLKNSSKFLSKTTFKSGHVKLGDFIDWRNFQTTSFGQKPVQSSFKLNISWTKFCILLVEIGYYILGLDPETYVSVDSSLATAVVDNNPDSPNDSINNSEEPMLVICDNNASDKSKLLLPFLKSIEGNVNVRNGTVVQVIEVIPKSNQDDKFKINISDGEYWVSVILDEESV